MEIQETKPNPIIVAGYCMCGEKMKLCHVCGQLYCPICDQYHLTECRH